MSEPRENSAVSARGRLVYLIGASGSGKDTLMRYARARLGDRPVLFAHRYITRAVHDGAEDHVVLTPSEFALRREAGLFALHWRAHHYEYGVGLEIEAWMRRGLTVVVNGARRYLPVARSRYPEIDVVWIEASPEIRGVRLQARGREDAAQIHARMQTQVACEPGGQDTVINNDGPVERAGEALIDHLIRPEVTRKARPMNRL